MNMNSQQEEYHPLTLYPLLSFADPSRSRLKLPWVQCELHKPPHQLWTHRQSGWGHRQPPSITSYLKMKIHLQSHATDWLAAQISYQNQVFVDLGCREGQNLCSSGTRKAELRPVTDTWEILETQMPKPHPFSVPLLVFSHQYPMMNFWATVNYFWFQTRKSLCTKNRAGKGSAFLGYGLRHGRALRFHWHSCVWQGWGVRKSLPAAGKILQIKPIHSECNTKVPQILPTHSSREFLTLTSWKLMLLCFIFFKGTSDKLEREGIRTKLKSHLHLREPTEWDTLF